MKRLQNKIAESRFSLAFTAAYALAVWAMLIATGCRNYIELLVFAVSSYLMVELNNRNALIRIYSRMVSCSFIVMGTMAAPATGSLDVLVVQLCFIMAYLILFSSYQDKRSQGRMFYAFAAIGIACTFFMQALFFVPVLWVLIATNLMAFSWRNFWASVIGLALPYWLLAGYGLISGDFAPLLSRLDFNAIVEPPALSAYLNADWMASAAFVTTLTIIGTVHFLRNSYKDKIRTRMIFELMATVGVFTILFLALQPQHAYMLTAILTIHAAALTGHFIALTNTRATNITFITLAAIALAITALNIAASYAPQINNHSPWSL